jgi:hypothetical protein
MSTLVTGSAATTSHRTGRDALAIAAPTRRELRDELDERDRLDHGIRKERDPGADLSVRSPPVMIRFALNAEIKRNVHRSYPAARGHESFDTLRGYVRKQRKNQRSRRRLKSSRSSPTQASVQAISATMNIVGKRELRNGSWRAAAISRVATAYIPNGNTAPQLDGS